MNDLPCSSFEINYDGSKLKRFEKEDDFELMLTAIEENSGHRINLATIEWGKDIYLQYDHTKPMYSRMNMNRLNSYCNLKKSQFVKKIFCRQLY